jgi:hypothetical protein
MPSAPFAPNLSTLDHHEFLPFVHASAMEKRSENRIVALFARKKFLPVSIK